MTQRYGTLAFSGKWIDIQAALYEQMRLEGITPPIRDSGSAPAFLEPWNNATSWKDKS
jgi:hypothetical protein